MTRIPCVSLAVGFALASTTVSAQAVDYSGLEEAFGEPVTTSVIGKPQRASELPASAVIITGEEIARSPARDVPGLLQSYAGIDVNRWTAGQSDVAVRGGVQTYNASLLVLVDGRQVYLDHYGETDWNLLGVQLADIEQIELVRGPATALFGFNAASGVVNIITRKGGNKTQASASVELGTHDYVNLTGLLMAPLTSNISARLTGGHHREAERSIPVALQAPADIPAVASDQVSGQVVGSFGSTEVTIDSGYSTNTQMEQLPTQLLSVERYRETNIGAAVKHDTVWGGISASAYVNWLDAQYGLDGAQLAAGAQVLPSRSIDNRIVVVQASSIIRLDDENTLRLGLEYRNNDAQSGAQFSSDISYDVASANIMVDAHPNDRISLTAAGRIDRLWLHQNGTIVQPAVNVPADFTIAFTKASFNAAALVDIGDHSQLRFNGGRGYQLPSLIDFGARIDIITPSPIPFVVAGSPSARPAEVWSGEIGYMHRLGAVRIEATAFYTRTNGAISTPADAGAFTLVMVNAPVLVGRIRAIGDYASHGVEISASGKTGILTWRANYTWTKTNDDLPSLTLPLSYSLSPASTTPRHHVNLAVGYDAGRWYVTALGRYTSKTLQFAVLPGTVVRQIPVNGAFAADARGGFRLRPSLEIFIAVENLGLARGAANSPIPADRRVRGGVLFTL